MPTLYHNFKYTLIFLLFYFILSAYSTAFGLNVSYTVYLSKLLLSLYKYIKSEIKFGHFREKERKSAHEMGSQCLHYKLLTTIAALFVEINFSHGAHILGLVIFDIILHIWKCIFHMVSDHWWLVNGGSQYITFMQLCTSGQSFSIDSCDYVNWWVSVCVCVSWFRAYCHGNPKIE